MNERVEADDIALLLLRLVAGGGIIALAIMPLPGTPLVKGHTWPAVLLALDAALVVAGVWTRPAALLGGIGSMAVMIAGVAAGQRFNFEPARDLMFACVFATVAIAGAGRLTVARPSAVRASPGQRDAAMLVLRVLAGLSLFVIDGLIKARLGIHAAATHSSWGFELGIARWGFPLPLLVTTLAVLNETLLPLLIAAGVFARPLSLAIVAHMLIGYTISAHYGSEDAVTALLYAASYAAIALCGPGRFAFASAVARRGSSAVSGNTFPAPDVTALPTRPT